MVERMELVAELWEENIKVCDCISLDIFFDHGQFVILLFKIPSYRLNLYHCVIPASLNNMNMLMSMTSNALSSSLTLALLNRVPLR